MIEEVLEEGVESVIRDENRDENKGFLMVRDKMDRDMGERLGE